MAGEARRAGVAYFVRARGADRGRKAAAGDASEII